MCMLLLVRIHLYDKFIVLFFFCLFFPIVNLPKPTRIISFLMALLGQPHKGKGRGEYILTCLKALTPILQEELVDLWDAVIPKLLAYLSGENRNLLNNHLLFWELITTALG